MPSTKTSLIFEQKVGDLNFYYFKKCWESGVIIRKFPIVLQAHPNMWTEKQWLHFEVCIAWMKCKGFEFCHPGDF